MQPDLFARLPDDARRTILLQDGDVLFRQDQPSTGLFQVREGCITLQRTSMAGHRLTLHRAVAGGLFAEASIFSQTYHCDAVCTGAGRVVKIAKPAILALMRSDPTFAEAFTRLLAVQVQQHRARIEILSIRSAKARCLAAVQAGYLDGTIPEFASTINLTHEACYRAFRALCQEGRMVQSGRGRYHLPG